MKKINFVFLMAMFTAIFMNSCSKVQQDETLPANEMLKKGTIQYTPPAGVNCMPVADRCGAYSYQLTAGQNIPSGTLVVANDANYLYVTYTSSGVEFGNLHLWVGTDLTLLPKNSQGTPVPGQFPLKFDATGSTTYTFIIPLTEISFYNGNCGAVIYVVAHAEMGSETAFGGDIKGSGTARWYFYAAYKTACCDTPPGGGNSSLLGTAFAKGGYVFTTDPKSNPEKLPSLNLTKNRWGWAINIKATGTTTYDVWVGAGLNNISKGKKIGTATVNFTGTQATVSYILSSGYSIEEAHTYVGDFKPTTLAPGQYGNIDYFDPYSVGFSNTYEVTDTNGDGIWLILHSVAWGPGVTNP